MSKYFLGSLYVNRISMYYDIFYATTLCVDILQIPKQLEFCLIAWQYLNTRGRYSSQNWLVLEMKVQAHALPWTFVWYISCLMSPCDFRGFLSITVLRFSDFIKWTGRWLTGINHDNTSAPRTALRLP